MAYKRDLALVVGGRFAAALLALITIRAVTSYLTPQQYGELALLVAIQMFCGLFLINPIGQHINLHTHAWWDDGTLMARLKSYGKYVFVVSLIGGAVALAMAKQQAAANIIWASITVFSIVIAGTWNATLVPMLNMLGFRAESVTWSVLTTICGLLASIGLVMWSPSATSWLTGQAVGMLVGLAGANHILKRNAKQTTGDLEKLPLLDRRTLMTYCLPLSAATGCMWMQLSGYRFVIESYWGLEQLGYLTIGLQLAGQISALVESLATQFFYPMFFRRCSAHGRAKEVAEAFSDLLNTLIPIYLVLTGLIVVCAPYLLQVLVAVQYQDATIFVMVGAGIELCRVLGNLLSNAAHIKRKTMSLTLPYAAGALMTLLMVAFAGIKEMPIQWASFALAVGSAVMLGVMWGNMGRQVRIRIDWLRWLSAALAMVTLSLTGLWLPTGFGIGISITMLIASGIVAGVISMTLLWKNPATMRLLDVQLGKG